MVKCYFHNMAYFTFQGKGTKVNMFESYIMYLLVTFVSWQLVVLLMGSSCDGGVGVRWCIVCTHVTVTPALIPHDTRTNVSLTLTHEGQSASHHGHLSSMQHGQHTSTHSNPHLNTLVIQGSQNSFQQTVLHRWIFYICSLYFCRCFMDVHTGISFIFWTYY